ncbi:MAG TPA: hypothetical protein ENN13_03560 [Candidatus Altiarchaeales archaeon]|nr:hypothetical protein [Candidatus Altiarchaeales archaeon]
MRAELVLITVAFTLFAGCIGGGEETGLQTTSTTTLASPPSGGIAQDFSEINSLFIPEDDGVENRGDDITSLQFFIFFII